MKALAAMSQNRVIGKDGIIPWHLPADLKFFKRMTLNQRIIVGRKTREKLPPLPERVIFTLSSKYSRENTKDNPNWLAAYYFTDACGRRFMEHYAESIENAGDDAWLCGGESIYRQYLPLCSDLYLTIIKQDYEGDAFMPEFENDFYLFGVMVTTPEYEIHHYKRY